MVGEKFGKWTVIKLTKMNKTKELGCLCKCECGALHIIAKRSLKQKTSTQCNACSHKKLRIQRIKHGMGRTKTYKSWQTMKQKCKNKNDHLYYLYGERDITFCKDWLKFENFYKDMGDQPEKTKLCRVDKKDDFDLSNCYWSPKVMSKEIYGPHSSHVKEPPLIRRLSHWRMH